MFSHRRLARHCLACAINLRGAPQLCEHTRSPHTCAECAFAAARSAGNTAEAEGCDAPPPAAAAAASATAATALPQLLHSPRAQQEPEETQEDVRVRVAEEEKEEEHGSQKRAMWAGVCAWRAAAKLLVCGPTSTVHAALRLHDRLLQVLSFLASLVPKHKC